MNKFKNNPSAYAKKFERISKFRKKLNSPKKTRRGGWKF